MRLLPVLAAALLLVGAGCTPASPELQLPTEPPAAPMVTEPVANGAPAMPAPEAPAQRPYYIAYTASGVSKALAEGRPVMLYFYASWCPICRAEDPKIKAWTEASSVPVAGFRVDYDTETALKEQYRIPYQHTAVFLNARGEEVERFTGPMSQADYEAAFAKAAK